MPVGRVSTRRELTAVVLALGGILVAVLALVVLLRLARGGDVEVHLGSETFPAGKVERMAQRVADDGPVLYSDVSGGTRDLYLNHLGPTPDSGWVAFAAHSPGSPRECFLRWQGDVGRFVDSCSGATFPPDGAGLEQFPVVVTNGQLDIDINRTAERKAQEQQATTSSVIESGIPRGATTTAPAAGSDPSPGTSATTAPPASGPTSSSGP